MAGLEDLQFAVIPKAELKRLQDTISQMANDIRDIKKGAVSDNSNEILSKKETAKLLKISQSSVWLWTQKGTLKSYHIQGRVFYKKNEVLKALVEL